jgi:hypothetical protein
MKNTLCTLLMAATLLCFWGCTSMESRSQKLQLGMTKTDAVELMGTDYSTVAARIETDGTPIAVLRYELKKNRPLFLYFRQDKLVQWGDTEVLNAMPATAQPK